MFFRLEPLPLGYIAVYLAYIRITTHTLVQTEFFFKNKVTGLRNKLTQRWLLQCLSKFALLLLLIAMFPGVDRGRRSLQFSKCKQFSGISWIMEYRMHISTLACCVSQ